MSTADPALRALQLVREALDVPAAGRDAFLRERCGDDDRLRARIEVMLQDIAGRGEEATTGLELDGELDDPEIEDSLIGTLVGPFRVLERIGRGGMGVVYLARREAADFDQEVALKLVRRGFDFDDIRRRFLRERRILASLDHPGLARFIDGGMSADGRPWLALEFVRGEAIDRWCDRQRLGVRERLRLFLQACAAVQHAHGQLVVHRDLKPGNILVDDRGQVRLLDFGIAKLLGDEGAAETGITQAGRRLLTLEYAAPEQLAGESIGVTADVYALGVIAYQLATGVLPRYFQGLERLSPGRGAHERPPPGLTQAIGSVPTGTDPASPDAAARLLAQRLEERRTTLAGYRRQVRGDLTRILDKALATEAQHRYPTVQAFADDLQRWLGGKPVQATGQAFGYRLRKFVARNRVTTGLALVAVIALLGGMLATAWQARRAERAAIEARAQAARATAARDFLASLLASASPEQQGGTGTTVREVLDLARDRIHAELADEPLLQVEMAGLIGQTYNQLGEPEAGLALLRDAVDLARAGAAIPARSRATAHMELAYALMASSQFAEAEQLAEQAARLLRPLGPSIELSRAINTLAATRYLQRRFDQALADQKEVVAMTRQLFGEEDARHVSAQLELAFFLTGAGQGECALAVARGALALVHQIHPEHDQPLVYRALWAVGSALSGLDRHAEAIAPLEEARDLVFAIHDHEGVRHMRALQLLGNARLGAGQVEAALRDLGAANRVLAEHAPEHPLAAGLHIAEARALLRSGLPEQALREVERAPDLARPASLAAVTREVDLVRVQALVAMARADEALVLVDAALLGLAGADEGADTLDDRAQLLVAKAQAQRVLGDLDGARETVGAAAALADELKPLAQADLRLEQARIAERLGQAAAASEQARAALAIFEALGATQGPEHALARQLLRGTAQP